MKMDTMADTSATISHAGAGVSYAAAGVPNTAASRYGVADAHRPCRQGGSALADRDSHFDPLALLPQIFVGHTGLPALVGIDIHQAAYLITFRKAP